jgi:L-iditol 2-dehydrogenase
MKALRKLKDGYGNMSIVEVPRPVLSEDEVLVEVKFAGVCGTDIHIFHGNYSKTRPPVTLCHEFCGIVAELGPSVYDWKVGDRVTSETAAYVCGKCRFCKDGMTQLCEKRLGFGYAADGAFAQFIKVNSDLLHKLPDHVSFREGALCEPLAVATHVVMERSSLKPGDITLVAGPGTIGNMIAQVAKAAGATVIVSGIAKDKERLLLAERLGIDYIVQSDKEDLHTKVSSLTGGYGVDVAIECTGVSAGINDCINCLRKGGELVTVGLHGKPVEIDLDNLTLRELNLVGSFAHNKASWIKAIELLSQEKVQLEPIIAGEYPLDNWQEPFKLFGEGKGLKYLLYPVE